MKRMFPNTFRLVVDRCSSSSGVSGPSFVSKAEKIAIEVQNLCYTVDNFTVFTSAS